MDSKKQERLHSGVSANTINVRALWIGVLNASLPGLGYVFLPHKRLFGWLLFIGSLCAIVARKFGFLALGTHEFNAIAVYFELGSIVLASIAFGYDAYREAKKI